MSSPRRDGPPVPEPVAALIRSLQRGSTSAWWVGESLHAAMRASPVQSFEVATSLTPDECLRRHPTAVPTRLEDATVMIPTAAGPVDVSTHRNGDDVLGDLHLRALRIHALAFDPVAGRLLDPFDGAADMESGTLRGVPVPAERLGEDPLRAVAACRVFAEFEYSPDEELLAAMGAVAESLGRVKPVRLRWELTRIARSPNAESAALWLHRAGLAGALFPGAQIECVRFLDDLPDDLATRIAWLLRGTRSGGTLRRLGFGRITATRVQHLLAHHPIENRVRVSSPSTLRRLLRRLSPEDLEALLRMRECEIAGLTPGPQAAARSRFDAFRAALTQLEDADLRAAQTPELALGGHAVMEALGCEPGPVIGRALSFLSECVARDPSCNTPDRLRSQIKDWACRRDAS